MMRGIASSRHAVLAVLAMTFLLLGCLQALSAQNLDSLYQVFEKNKGEVAYQAAVAIDETIGREPNFTLETDKDEIKLKILRTMILYFFGNDDFQRVITYSVKTFRQRYFFKIDAFRKSVVEYYRYVVRHGIFCFFRR